MKNSLKKIISVALLTALPMLAQVAEEPYKPDVGDLVDELFQSSPRDNIHLVWWMPDEYWAAAIDAYKAAKPGTKKLALNLLKPYIIVGAVDGEISIGGKASFKSDAQVQSELRIFDADGNPYLPLDNKDIDADVITMINAMRPIFSAALGETGKNLQFYAFRRDDGKGNPIASATGKGRFRIHSGDEDFYFRLPVAALKPKVKCANDSEALPSNYLFCPFDGTPTVPFAAQK